MNTSLLKLTQANNIAGVKEWLSRWQLSEEERLADVILKTSSPVSSAHLQKAQASKKAMSRTATTASRKPKVKPAPKRAIDEQNAAGQTALHIAAEKGFDDILIALLGAGCSNSIKDVYGYTPMHWAVYTWRVSTVNYLLEYNCPVEKIVDLLGRTPVDLANDSHRGLIARPAVSQEMIRILRRAATQQKYSVK